MDIFLNIHYSVDKALNCLYSFPEVIFKIPIMDFGWIEIIKTKILNGKNIKKEAV